MKFNSQFKSEIRGIVPYRGPFDISSMDLISYSFTLGFHASKQREAFIQNEGISGADYVVSKTSLAHKVMFDFCEGPINIFSRGLHNNIFSIDFVIESFSRYVRSVLSDDDKLASLNDRAIISVLLKPNSGGFSDIKNSPFYARAREIEKSVSDSIKVLEVRKLEELSIDDEIPIIINGNQSSKEVEMSRILGPVSIASIPSFSTFGDFIRVRNTAGYDNSAILNFGSIGLKNKLNMLFSKLWLSSKSESQ